MNGCVALRKDTYYVRLTYYDKNHCRKEKWISTGLYGRGAKQKATAMIDSMIEKYSYLEKSDHPTKMADYLQMWKELRKSAVAETTYDGYHTYIDRHLIPYFKELNLNIQDIYVGKMDWCGLERYVNDLHAYIGEKHTENMLLIEIMTVGEDFSLTFMQSGRGEKYLNAFLQEIRALDIPVSLVGEEKYALCNTCLPE